MSIEEKIMRADDAAAKKKKLRNLSILIMILLLIIAALLYFWFSKKPITSIVSGGTAKPVYIQSFSSNFDWPLGVAVSVDGQKVYVVDSNHRQIKSFDPGGRLLATFGKQLTDKTSGEGFLNPVYIAVSPVKGDVYVTDRTASVVQIYTASGKYVSRFTPETGEKDFTWSPLAITFDKSGNVYVVDAKKDAHRVLVFDKGGKLKFQFGKEGQNNGEFEYPNGITVKDNGDIYVADSNNSRVQVFDKNGKFKFILGKGGKNTLGRPLGIAFDGKGRLNVADTFSHTVMVYEASGKFLYKYGDYGNGNGQFMFPMGLAAFDNTIYVVDREGKRLEVWQY